MRFVKMYCANCGTQLPDDARFCPNCGKQQKDDPATAQSNREQYEYCEIVFDGRKTGLLGTINFIFDGGFDAPDNQIKFWAEVSDPNGTFSVGSTEWFGAIKGYPISKEHGHSYDNLKNQLLQKRWEQIGSGERWYNAKFRRVIKPKSN